MQIYENLCKSMRKFLDLQFKIDRLRRSGMSKDVGTNPSIAWVFSILQRAQYAMALPVVGDKAHLLSAIQRPVLFTA